MLPFNAEAFLADMPTSLLLAQRAGVTLAEKLNESFDAGAWNAAALLANMQTAFRSSQPSVRLLAAHAVATAGAQQGWSAQWRAVLKVAREDADVEVRRAGYAVFCDAE
jgi:hypothetical protein